MQDIGFPCSSHHDAEILILGSMPGRESLRQQQYYAHPRNAFWVIMGQLFGIDPLLPYQERLELLKNHHIALWDVAHRCIRPGSLDADIQDVEANDFREFFSQHHQIRHVFFNGRKAEALYRKLALPALPTATTEYSLLPSTSPAHAAMSVAQKLAAWSIIKPALEIDQD